MKNVDPLTTTDSSPYFPSIVLFELDDCFFDSREGEVSSPGVGGDSGQQTGWPLSGITQGGASGQLQPTLKRQQHRIQLANEMSKARVPSHHFWEEGAGVVGCGGWKRGRVKEDHQRSAAANSGRPSTLNQHEGARYFRPQLRLKARDCRPAFAPLHGHNLSWMTRFPTDCRGWVPKTLSLSLSAP